MAWQWLCDTLERLGLLAKSDVAIMTLYCETWAEYVKARQEVEQYGFVMISPKTGNPFINPLVNVEAMLKKQLLQHLSELGLSPTSRTRLHADRPQEPESGRARFFKTVG
jgi:P27 family predicted phage terminase small subunit